jgi:hypothetical protein
MSGRVRAQSGDRPVRGCLAIAVCLVLAAGVAGPAWAAEPAAAEVAEEAIVPPVAVECEAEFAAQADAGGDRVR